MRSQRCTQNILIMLCRILFLRRNSWNRLSYGNCCTSCLIWLWCLRIARLAWSSIWVMSFWLSKDNLWSICIIWCLFRRVFVRLIWVWGSLWQKWLLNLRQGLFWIIFKMIREFYWCLWLLFAVNISCLDKFSGCFFLEKNLIRRYFFILMTLLTKKGSTNQRKSSWRSLSMFCLTRNRTQ